MLWLADKRRSGTINMGAEQLIAWLWLADKRRSGTMMLDVVLDVAQAVACGQAPLRYNSIIIPSRVLVLWLADKRRSGTIGFRSPA